MKTCVIYCPSHRPLSSPAKRRRHIEALLSAADIRYDLVQSDHAQNVERIVSRAIADGYDRIVIAGGDSALCDTANCLMALERHERERLTIGVIPNGTMNDFAAYWGFRYNNTEEAVAAIAQGRVRRIDVGVIRYTNERGEERRRYFLNSVNIGLLAAIQRLRQQTRHTFGSRHISFAFAFIALLFQKMAYAITYTINHETERHHVATMCVGSALGYGQTPNAVPYSGMLDVTVVCRTAMLSLVEGIYLFLRGEILNHRRVRPYRTRTVEVSAPPHTPVSIDGHPMETPAGPFRIDIEQEEINFIIEADKFRSVRS